MLTPYLSGHDITVERA